MAVVIVTRTASSSYLPELLWGSACCRTRSSPARVSHSPGPASGNTDPRAAPCPRSSTEASLTHRWRGGGSINTASLGSKLLNLPATGMRCCLTVGVGGAAELAGRAARLPVLPAHHRVVTEVGRVLLPAGAGGRRAEVAGRAGRCREGLVRHTEDREMKGGIDRRNGEVVRDAR